MRCFLILFSLLYIIQPCFAIKSGEGVIMDQVKLEHKINQASKVMTQEIKTSVQNLHHDYMEPLNHVCPLKSYPSAGFILPFQHPVSPTRNAQEIKTLIADPKASHPFIYKCLYPKHVFW